MGRRIVVVLVSSCIGSLGLMIVGPAAAYACEEPTLGLHKTEARAGETVPFSVTGTEHGASFRLSTEGWSEPFTDNTAETGYKGSFVMPDLGGETKESVYITFTGEHEGAFDPMHKPIRYVASAPPAPAEEPAPAPAADSKNDKVGQSGNEGQQDPLAPGDVGMPVGRQAAPQKAAQGGRRVQATKSAEGAQRVSKSESSESASTSTFLVARVGGAIPAAEDDAASAPARDTRDFWAMLFALMAVGAAALRRRSQGPPGEVVAVLGPADIEERDAA